MRRSTESEQEVRTRRDEYEEQREGKTEIVLTVFSASDVGQDPEALGLQVGSTTSPFRHILGCFSWPDHCLVNRRRAVYHRVLDRQSATARQRVLLEL